MAIHDSGDSSPDLSPTPPTPSAGDAPSVWRFITQRQTWLTPLILLLGLAVVFPAIYLTATTDPARQLSGMPIALVVEEQDASVTPAHDAAAVVAAAAASGAFEQVVTAIGEALDSEKFALVTLTPDEFRQRMSEDSIAAGVVIPSDFTASIASLLTAGTTNSGTVATAKVRIATNAGDGGISDGLVNGNVTPVLAEISQRLGANLVAAMESQATASGASVTSAEIALLSAPFDIENSAYSALPEHSGLGTSAFYYSLVLVLLGFIGASLINPFVDSAMGFAPSELGPLVARRPYIKFSRRHTLLTKVGLLVTIAPVAALATQLVSGWFVGLPLLHPIALWLFSSAAIAAIGVGALTVFAIFGGGIGSLVNTIFFIALSMTASGGTVPLAATPPFFRWLANVEPFRAVVDGVRAILYFDANPAAGLSEAWVRVCIGAAVGLALGIAVTTLYARKRMFTRHPRPTTIS